MHFFLLLQDECIIVSIYCMIIMLIVTVWLLLGWVLQDIYNIRCCVTIIFISHRHHMAHAEVASALSSHLSNWIITQYYFIYATPMHCSSMCEYYITVIVLYCMLACMSNIIFTWCCWGGGGVSRKMHDSYIIRFRTLLHQVGKRGNHAVFTCEVRVHMAKYEVYLFFLQLCNIFVKLKQAKYLYSLEMQL